MRNLFCLICQALNQLSISKPTVNDFECKKCDNIQHLLRCYNIFLCRYLEKSFVISSSVTAIVGSEKH